jgi:GT2 family glycosyltransferase
MGDGKQAEPAAARIAVLIPTRSDRPEDVRLDHVLHSLLFSTFCDLRVVVRDEGMTAAFDSRTVRQFTDLLARRGVRVEYHRATSSGGVAVAREELVAMLHGEPYACFVDDDMCLAPDAIARLHDALDAHPDRGFVQGQKIEADRSRRYVNDINMLSGADAGGEEFRIWFGDAALLLLRSSALAAVRWDVVTRYRLEGLPGEDVALSLLIADRHPCYAVPAAVAYHLSPQQSRWTWEAPSDALQLELLRPHVSAETLRRALPHLAEQIG